MKWENAHIIWIYLLQLVWSSTLVEVLMSYIEGVCMNKQPRSSTIAAIELHSSPSISDLYFLQVNPLNQLKKLLILFWFAYHLASTAVCTDWLN